MGSDGLGDTLYVVDSENADGYPLMRPCSEHDIGLRVYCSKNLIPQGYNITVRINMTVINYGAQTETFNLTFKLNATVHEQLLTLPRRNSTTMTFTWNAQSWAKGNYTLITANASAVPGETDTSDNTLAGVWVVVTIPGDLNVDGKVNILDLSIVARAFGTLPGYLGYSRYADTNDDGVINILDLSFIAKYFGSHDA
jgi:hypothetical protein